MPTKTIFIPAIKKINLNKTKLKANLSKLPNTIYILYTIQYKKIAQQIRTYLSNKGKKIIGFSQILGCSKLKTNKPLLLISEARFHALNLLNQNKSNQIYIFNNYNLTKLSKKDLSELELKQRRKLNLFYNSKKLGILISLKPGQLYLDKALKLKQKLRKEKKTYLFLTDNININEFENFNLDLFVNTACPRLEEDSMKIINLS